jgi:hypothetical protein
MQFGAVVLFAVSAASGGAFAGPVGGGPPISLASPIACEVGKTCFIQQYADHGKPGHAQDYHCGGRTYPGHDGTDFRAPDLAAERRGVNVLAAAAGVVLELRDGMDDVSVDRIGQGAVKGRECGNGVLVAHPGGWQTQYCHMMKGSVVVTRGQAVRTGQVLGQLGMSGDAAFPHLHLSVRHDRTPVDPFAYGAAPEACGGGASLWSPAATAQFAYRYPAVINRGFAGGPVSMDRVDEGDVPPPVAGSDALVAYARAIGLDAGDLQSLTLADPSGAVIAQADSPPLDHDKAQWLIFAGVRRTGDWAAGAYTATYVVTRGGGRILVQRFDVRLPRL